MRMSPEQVRPDLFSVLYCGFFGFPQGEFFCLRQTFILNFEFFFHCRSILWLIVNFIGNQSVTYKTSKQQPRLFFRRNYINLNSFFVFTNRYKQTGN